MYQQIEISNAQLAEAIRTIQSFISNSSLEVTNVLADVAGITLDNINPADLAHHQRISLNLTIEMRNPHFDGNSNSHPGSHLVSSNLFHKEENIYRDQIVDLMIGETIEELDFFRLAQDLVNETLNKALRKFEKKKETLDANPEVDHYQQVVNDTIQALKTDPGFRQLFNSRVSQMVANNINNPVFLAKSKLVLSRQLDNVMASRILQTDDDFARMASNYLQLQLDEAIRNIYISIAKDAQGDGLKLPESPYEVANYIRSKIAEQQSILRSKAQLYQSNALQDLADIKRSVLSGLENEDKLATFLNNIIQSKINYAILEAHKLGHIEASLILKNDSTLSQQIGHEINEYIAHIVMQHLQNSQLLIKSQMIAKNN